MQSLSEEALCVEQVLHCCKRGNSKIGLFIAFSIENDTETEIKINSTAKERSLQLIMEK